MRAGFLYGRLDPFRSKTSVLDNNFGALVYGVSPAALILDSPVD